MTLPNLFCVNDLLIPSSNCTAGLNTLDASSFSVGRIVNCQSAKDNAGQLEAAALTK